MKDITFVIIGRNESLHLARTFESVLKVTDNIVYVDSNSTDNSISIAKAYGIKKIIKVTSSHGTAALSRSKGAEIVTTKYIQFLDGDETIDQNWLRKAVNKIKESDKIIGVHGYKKVYKNDSDNFYILSDKKDWEPDYLQGAFLIERSTYEKVGGMETRIFGEEERDLYVRIVAHGKQIWYIHELMASHYDWKKKTFIHTIFGPSSFTIWVPFFKAIKNRQLTSYLFVYRYLIFPLFIDLLCLFLLFYGIKDFLVIGIILQAIELLYCYKINRRGYFLTWKAAIINFPRVISVYLQKRTTKVQIIV